MNRQTAMTLIHHTMAACLDRVPESAIVDQETVRVEIRILDTTPGRSVAVAVPVVALSTSFRLVPVGKDAA